MDSERLLFEKGCFLPGWVEDENEDIQPAISPAYQYQMKDLPTLLEELAQIEKHLEDVREREWILTKLLNFHNNGLAKE